MRFRPDDQYCKPAVARPNKTSCLLLKVKRKRRSKDEGEDDVVQEGDKTGQLSQSGLEAPQDCTKKEYSYSAKLVGIVNTVYQFPGMSRTPYYH